VLAVDSVQPDPDHEAVWVLRGCLSGEVLLARRLLSATSADLTALLTEVRNALTVPIVAVVSDGQETIRQASAWPAAPPVALDSRQRSGCRCQQATAERRRQRHVKLEKRGRRQCKERYVHFS
jgi:hypothetical protein